MKSEKKGKKIKEKAADALLGPSGEELLGPELTRETAKRVGERVGEVVERARDAGVPVIEGAAVVTLSIRVDEGITPTFAVNRAIHELAEQGLRNYVYLVRDEETDEMYLVEHGQVIEESGDEESEDDEE